MCPLPMRDFFFPFTFFSSISSLLFDNTCFIVMAIKFRIIYPQDLLESCGGDRSAPHSWPRLRALSLMFNTIPDLDDSLVSQLLGFSHDLTYFPCFIMPFDTFLFKSVAWKSLQRKYKDGIFFKDIYLISVFDVL